ncbi:MAG: 3'(2'),5'-bisphosphate nucleotidase CysQ [Chitinophagales bacterium]|jgi:3'(2'), 5'-bisphosphate nucleotidase|nr:3'(2'),5'-bisphosphate nucleotidase CysQ [Chitinophagales bacterium]
MKDFDIEEIIEIAVDAGKEIMVVYDQDFTVELKGDNSPLTLADQKSNNIIVASLKELYPDIPVISEETKLIPYEDRKNWKMYWLVDPLDGTKEFIKKNGEFTVNIALMSHDRPILGVVYAPAQKLIWYGIKGEGSFKMNGDGTKIPLKKGENWRHLQKVNVVASRSHLNDDTLEFVEDLKKEGREVEFVSSGSSLKFCLVAEGKADVYPRFGPTMEWDTAAGQAVIELAGGRVLNWETNKRLEYNKENLLNPYFIAEFA